MSARENVSILPPRTKVRLLPVDCDATVNYVKIDLGLTPIYNVCFFTDGQQRFCDVFEEEVREVAKTPEIHGP